MDAVSSHAAEHHSLLQQLGELDYAHSALDQAKARLAGLRKDLEEQKKELSEVEKKTRKEYDDWQKVQNSVLRRAKLRVKGGKDNLEARVEKEEREWLEALREEGRQKDRIATTQREIDETEELVKDLAGLSDQHTRVQKRLDSMYEHVFAGPSDHFPEEDNAEADVYALEKEYKDVQDKINNLAQSVNLLAKADAALILAQKEMDNASNSLDVPLFFRGTFAEVMERNYIERAAVLSSKVSSYYLEAKSYDDALAPTLNLPNLISLANTYFDDRFYISGYNPLALLSQSVDTARLALKSSFLTLRRQIREAQSRTAALELESKRAHLKLRRARAHLDATRRAILVDIHASNSSTRQAPRFTEEPESFDDGDARPMQSQSNNPYAEFLLRRATTLDANVDTPPPAYIPRTRDFQ